LERTKIHACVGDKRRKKKGPKFLKKPSTARGEGRKKKEILVYHHPAAIKSAAEATRVLGGDARGELPTYFTGKGQGRKEVPTPRWAKKGGWNSGNGGKGTTPQKERRFRNVERPKRRTNELLNGGQGRKKRDSLFQELTQKRGRAGGEKKVRDQSNAREERPST